MVESRAERTEIDDIFVRGIMGDVVVTVVVVVAVAGIIAVVAVAVGGAVTVVAVAIVVAVVAVAVAVVAVAGAVVAVAGAVVAVAVVAVTVVLNVDSALNALEELSLVGKSAAQTVASVVGIRRSTDLWKWARASRCWIVTSCLGMGTAGLGEGGAGVGKWTPCGREEAPRRREGTLRHAGAGSVDSPAGAPQ